VVTSGAGTGPDAIVDARSPDAWSLDDGAGDGAGDGADDGAAVATGSEVMPVAQDAEDAEDAENAGEGASATVAEDAEDAVDAGAGTAAMSGSTEKVPLALEGPGGLKIKTKRQPPATPAVRLLTMV
jgi:hypothetical protein